MPTPAINALLMAVILSPSSELRLWPLAVLLVLQRAPLERRHAAARPVDDLLGFRPAARLLLQHDELLDALAAIRVRRADHARLLNVRVRVEHRLDFRRPDLETGGVDHALQAVGDEEVALLVVVAEA